MPYKIHNGRMLQGKEHGDGKDVAKAFSKRPGECGPGSVVVAGSAAGTGRGAHRAVCVFAEGAVCCLMQAGDDAAAAVAVVGGAFMAQFFEVCPQVPEGGDLSVDIVYVVFDHAPHPAAVCLGGILKDEEPAYIGEFHAVVAAVEDKAQSILVRIPIEAVVAVAALGPGQKPFLFVIPDGDHLAAGLFGQFSDFHRIFLYAVQWAPPRPHLLSPGACLQTGQNFFLRSMA